MTDKRPFSRHGLNVVKANVKVKGLTAIDNGGQGKSINLIFQRGKVRAASRRSAKVLGTEFPRGGD